MAEPYIKIPLRVLQDTSLSLIDGVLYGQVSALCHKSNECWASNGALAKALGVSEKSISRSVTALAEHGYISVAYKGAGNTGRVICDLRQIVQGRTDSPDPLPTDPAPWTDSPPPLDTQSTPLYIDKSLDKKENIYCGLFAHEVNEYTSNPELIEALSGFIEMRQEQAKGKGKTPFTARALKVAFGKLDKYAEPYRNKDGYKIECLNEAVLNGWRGVFTLKDFEDSGGVVILPTPTEKRDTREAQSLSDIFSMEQAEQAAKRAVSN